MEKKVNDKAVCKSCSKKIDWIQKKFIDGLVPMCRNVKCSLYLCFDEKYAVKPVVTA